jgi:hypothetical protein
MSEYITIGMGLVIGLGLGLNLGNARSSLASTQRAHKLWADACRRQAELWVIAAQWKLRPDQMLEGARRLIRDAATLNPDGEHDKAAAELAAARKQIAEARRYVDPEPPRTPGNLAHDAWARRQEDKP